MINSLYPLKQQFCQSYMEWKGKLTERLLLTLISYESTMSYDAASHMYFGPSIVFFSYVLTFFLGSMAMSWRNRNIGSINATKLCHFQKLLYCCFLSSPILELEWTKSANINGSCWLSLFWHSLIDLKWNICYLVGFNYW